MVFEAVDESQIPNVQEIVGTAANKAAAYCEGFAGVREDSRSIEIYRPRRLRRVLARENPTAGRFN